VSASSSSGKKEPARVPVLIKEEVARTCPLLCMHYRAFAQAPLRASWRTATPARCWRAAPPWGFAKAVFNHYSRACKLDSLEV
jgi:hypothetical protein